MVLSHERTGSTVLYVERFLRASEVLAYSVLVLAVLGVLALLAKLAEVLYMKPSAKYCPACEDRHAYDAVSAHST